MPVCGLELGRHHQEQPRLCSHRMSVPTQREKEEGQMSVSSCVDANECVVALRHCRPW